MLKSPSFTDITTEVHFYRDNYELKFDAKVSNLREAEQRTAYFYQLPNRLVLNLRLCGVVSAQRVY